MTQEPRYSIKCHLTPAEYEEQKALALADFNRSMPVLTRISEKGHLIGEHLIGRIAADAWASATGHELSDDAQTRIELQSACWPFADKLRFINNAGPYWSLENDESPSHWDGEDATALALLGTFPEMLDILRGDTDASAPKCEAETTL